MASELLLLKSRSLLPGEDIEDEYFVLPLNPELAGKLLEYKKIQLTSMELLERFEKQSDLFTRKSTCEMVDGEELIEISLFDLINAFAKVLKRDKALEYNEIVFDEIFVIDIINRISKMLSESMQIMFFDIFSNNTSHAEIVVSFLAILEMAKTGKIRLIQHRIFGPIRIFRI